MNPHDCPSPEVLSRFACDPNELDDAVVEAHVTTCPKCQRVLESWTQDKKLAQDLPYRLPSADKLDRLEEDLIRSARLAPKPRRVWPAMIGSAAAAAVLTFGLTKGFQDDPVDRKIPVTAVAQTPPPTVSAPTRNPTSDPNDPVTVKAEPTTRYERRTQTHGDKKDETILLSEGRLELVVTELAPTQQFQVIAEDAQLNGMPASGAAFAVEVKQGSLTVVEVISGEVVVTPEARLPITLHAGQTWRRDDMPSVRQERQFADGWSAWEREDLTAAAAAFARAVEAEPQGDLAPDARYWHAMALLRADQPEAATKALTTFLQAHPTAARAGQAAVVLGGLLIQAGNRAAARASFEAAAQNPDAEIRRMAAKGLEALRDTPKK